ncbi:LolA family protein [Flindersiella endophytica]
MFTSRPALRWIVPAAALAVVAGVTGTVLRADAAGALPPRSAKQLLVDLQTAQPEPFSGTVVQQARLGLPELPALSGDDNSSDLSSLVSGNHTLKVWYDSPQRVRLALLGTLGESDIIRNGRDLWMWSSNEKSAQHRTLPASSVEPEGPVVPDANQLPKTPQEAADQALAALDPTTKVTTDGTARVAGLDAYQLVLSPRDQSSLVGQIRLAIDAKSHLPLQVQVYARGASDPAFQVGFTRITFGRPSADHFTFSPPPGTKVEQARPGKDQPDEGRQTERRGDQTDAASAPKLVGKGWLTVVVARTTEPGRSVRKPGGDFGAIVQSLPKVSGSWGSGRLLKGSLFTVLFTDDGRVLAGAVAPERLYSVAGTTR